MKATEKILILKRDHPSEWWKTRQVAEDELSEKQAMFCVCGRLATGLHERSCRRFNRLVDSETVKKLKHLLPNGRINTRTGTTA